MEDNEISEEKGPRDRPILEQIPCEKCGSPVQPEYVLTLFGRWPQMMCSHCGNKWMPEEFYKVADAERDTPHPPLPGTWVLTFQRAEDYPHGCCDNRRIENDEANAILDAMARAVFKGGSFIKYIKTPAEEPEKEV